MTNTQKDERNTLSRLAVDSLKHYILDNNLKPGDKLPSERELVKLMNLSRSVLREALSALENAGIVEIRHGGGTFVKDNSDLSSLFEQLLFMWKLGDKRQSDLLELRRIFESAAIEEAVRQASDQDLDELEQTAMLLTDRIETKSIQDADILFHRGLIKATNNELFIQMADLIIEYFSNIPHNHMTEKERNKALDEHLQIVHAIQQRDALTAKKLLSDHFNNSNFHQLSGDDTL